MLGIILKQLFILYIFIFLGWLLGKINPKQTDHTGILSFLLVNLFLPCKVFTTFSKNFTVSYITENYKTIFLSTTLLLIIVVISKLCAHAITKDEYERKVYRYSLTLSNYAYMGYALCEWLFGESGLTDLILFCIPFAIYTYTFGYAMLTGKGNMAKKLLNPLTASILLGMAVGLSPLNLPDVFTSVLSTSSACVAPVSMLLTGMTLSAFSMKALVTDVKAYILVAIRLLGLPLLVFSACKLLSLDSIIMPATLMACMPCGLNSIVFPKLIGEDCLSGAKLATLSHLFSVLTVPLWNLLIS
jgi:predicted permease